MKTPIAIYNLWHQGTKTLVSIGGVAFALLLVFMQLGFMGAVSHTATNVLEKLEFDILLRPTDYLHLYESSSFDRHWLQVAQNTEGVETAHPFWIIIQNWRKLPTQQALEEQAPDSDSAGREEFESQYLPIAVMAFEPDSRVFRANSIPALERHAESLHRDNALLLDNSTKADYGPWDGRRFTERDVELSFSAEFPERTPEIGGMEYEIVGLFKLGTGLAANAAAIMGDRAFGRVFPWDIQKKVSLGLIRLKPGFDAALVAEQLQQRFRVALTPTQLDLQDDAQIPWFTESASNQGTAVAILSREEALQAEKDRWLWKTPIGLIFQMGVIIALLVGAAIVYMVLSTDVANRLPEYATLLAMGYSRTYLVGIVMTQAIVLCGLGFLTAWGLAEILYRVTSTFSGIPLIMTPDTVALVAVLGLLMCVVSGLLALRKLWKAEPANLF